MSDSQRPHRPLAEETETAATLDLRGGVRATPEPDLSPPPGPGHWNPDDEIAGRYRIVRFLARGGLGEVYEAENREMGDRVALKMLRPEKARDDDTVERFRREFQLARRVTHPNICRIYDAGVHRDERLGPVFYLTMELLEGETLEERIARGGPIPPGPLDEIVAQICGALGAAHRVGVLHRDLKSSNVMLVDDGAGGERVVVTDFGLARAIRPRDDDFKTAAGAILGTPAAMSPEQVEGADELTPASDLYSLGVLIFEAATGTLPFSAGSPLDTAILRLTQDPPVPSSRHAGLEPRWDRAILACLERDPSRRPVSAEAVVELLSGDGGSTGPAPRIAGLPAWLRWAVVVALAVGVGLFLGRATDPPAQRADPTPASAPEALRLVQLTTSPGLDIDPAFTPDGGSVVFSSDRSGDLELWTLQLTPGGVARALTSDGGRNVQPHVSPDGRWIVYTSLVRGGIWRIPALGGRAEQLTTFGARPRYSPDGSRIAFQEDGRWDASARSASAQPGSTIWMVGADGGEPVQWTEIGRPAGGHGEPGWARDGSLLVFSAGDRRRTGLWTVDGPGNEPRPLLDPAEWRWTGSAVFEAGDRGLLFCGIREDQREAETHAVWRLPLGPDLEPAGPPERLSRFGSAAIRQLAPGPDGRRIAYGSLETRSNLWILRFENGRPGPPEPLTRGNDRSSRPAVSPDGRRIAFDRWPIGRDLDLWVLDLETPGAEARQLTLDPGRDSQASWTPDGRTVVYSSDRGGGDEIRAVDVADGTERSLVELGAEADWARLSPDGKTVAFHSRRDGPTIDLWLADLASGEMRRLTELEEPIGFPAWSPDGRYLAAEIQRGDESVLAIVEVAGGRIREIATGAEKSWPYSWSPDGARIALAGLGDEGWNIWTVTLDGAVERLTDHSLFDGYVRYPAWSPDGRFLVYELADTTGDLWIAEE